MAGGRLGTGGLGGAEPSVIAHDLRAVPASFPWLYPYTAERQPWRNHEVLLPPVVPVSLAGADLVTAPRIGLVDTGAENVLAAGWLADLACVDVLATADVALIGIGGQTAEVHFTEVELRLYGPDVGEGNVSFRCDVGFVPGWQAPFALVLGQSGFLDRFTVTFHRGAAMLAIEAWDAFDTRFGTVRRRDA